MAGSLSLSLSQQFDSQGRPLSGGKLYFFQTGTSTPQNAYQDTPLTIAHPNPLTLDSSGRIPAFYLADGTIKIRLADISGVTILAYDGLLVIGPSSGGGSPPSVDATTVLATGDVKAKYGTGTLAGFVRLNARTMGSATSGATERANADTQPLFEYLWNTDPNLAVSGGRGGSSTADFTANKTITLPDFRGRAPAALDDMGNTAAGRLTSGFFGASGIVLGNSGGAESHALTIAELAAHNHPVFLNETPHSHALPGSAHWVNISASANGFTTSNPGGTVDGGTAAVNPSTTGITVRDTTGGGGTANQTAPSGSGTAHAIVSPTILVTYYIKL
jgi:microcystin-dependent protein